MPEVKGLLKKTVNYDLENYDSIKIINEVKELMEIDYELIYNKKTEVYELYFELTDRLYCVKVPKEIIYERDSVLGVLFEYIGDDYRYVNFGYLGKNISDLCSNISKIIKNDTSERIKFLLNNGN